LTYTELLARVNIFLAILSGAVIAPALVAQADRFGTTFVVVAIPVLRVAKVGRTARRRALTTSSGEGVLAQTLRHRSYHLDRELVIPLDRVAELGMAQHHGLGRSFGHDRRGGWSLVKHPDLSEEVAGPKPGGRLAFANDMHMAARQNEKRSGWLPLRDQSLARLQADLIHLAGQKLQLTLAEFRKEGHLAQPFDLWIWHVRNSTPR
jgi:hypothetical protein